MSAPCLVLLLLAAGAQSYQCPDGSYCSEAQTCCEYQYPGNYGCCPFSGASCCTDLLHCCDSSHVCILDLCFPRSAISNELAKLSYRSDNATRCSSNGYCPLPGAVCCSDGVHCCPSGTVCDEERKTCTTRMIELHLFDSTPCGNYSCPADTTCCPPDGCCQLPNAVCCPNLFQCCPNGYKCGPASCVPEDQVDRSLVIEDRSRSGVLPLANHLCPDEESLCRDNNTCCMMMSGRYGCCPSPDAVCCSDKVHCCPHGKVCGNAMCEDQVEESSLLAIVLRPVANQLCPDGQTTCSDNDNTCCVLSSGHDGCCPLPDAVCCPDKRTCCPNGYACNDTNCTRGNAMQEQDLVAVNHNHVTRASEIIESGRRLQVVSYTTEHSQEITTVGSHPCPDKSSCDDNSTCCLISSSRYGCCPLQQAVCCPDLVHCCPKDYQCVKTGCLHDNEIEERPLVPISSDHQIEDRPPIKSDHGQEVRSLLLVHSHQRFRSLRDDLDDQTCPDGNTCPDIFTCCAMYTGQYGCCPAPLATCCPDLIHCCPNGYYCGGTGCWRNNATSPEYGTVP